MIVRRYIQATAFSSLLAIGLLLAGCASKSADTPPGSVPAADAKMGSDYGKGVAAQHAKQTNGGASPAPSNP